MGDVIKVGSLGVRFLVEGPDSDGSVAVFEARVPTGGKPPAPHSHDGYEETIYGVEGATTWTVEGATIEIGPGDALCIRRGDVHHFENHADADAVFLAIVSPGVLGPDFFREVGAAIEAAGDAPPDLEKVGAVMRKHGLTPSAT